MKLSRTELSRLINIFESLPQEVTQIELIQECPSTLGLTTYVCYDSKVRIDITQDEALN